MVVPLQRKKARVKGTKRLQGSLTLATTSVGMQGYCQESSTNIYNRIGCCLSSVNPTPLEAQKRREHKPVSTMRKKQDGAAVLLWGGHISFGCSKQQFWLQRVLLILLKSSNGKSYYKDLPSASSYCSFSSLYLISSCACLSVPHLCLLIFIQSLWVFPIFPLPWICKLMGAKKGDTAEHFPT